MKDLYYLYMPIHNNLFHFSHRCYELGETKSVLQTMFHVFQRTISAIKFKELFRKMEFNFTKLREVCIPNRPIVKILLHFLHSYHRLGEFKRFSQVIFQKFTSLLSESSVSEEDSKELEVNLEKRRHGFCRANGKLQKPLPYVTQISPLEIYRRNFETYCSVVRILK